MSFCTAHSLCSYHFNASSSVIPNTFLLNTCLIECLAITISGVSVNCFSFRFDAISINSVFLMFKVSLFITNQELTLSRSSLILFSMSAGEMPEVQGRPEGGGGGKGGNLPRAPGLWGPPKAQ